MVRALHLLQGILTCTVVLSPTRMYMYDARYYCKHSIVFNEVFYQTQELDRPLISSIVLR